ncbi:MAG: hypothetical protein AAGN15_02630 [Cyanobacteria bacterium J06581_3]
MFNSFKGKCLIASLGCLCLGSLFGSGLPLSAIAQSNEPPLYLWNIVRFYSGLPQQDAAIRILQTQIEQDNPELLAADSIASNIWRDSPTFIGHEDILGQIEAAARSGDDPLEMALAIASPRTGAPLTVEVLPVDNIESPGRVIVTIEKGGFLDDSVAGSRHRFDMQLESEQWIIQRAGRQFRCRRGQQEGYFEGPCP